MEIATQRITKVKALIHPDWMSWQFGNPTHPAEFMLSGSWDTEAQRDALDPECLWVYCSPLHKEQLNISGHISTDGLSPIIPMDRARRDRYQDQLGNRLIIFPSSPWPDEIQLQGALAQRSLTLDLSTTLEPFGIFFEECVRSGGQSIKTGLGITDANYLYLSGERLSLSAKDAPDIRRWKYRQRYRLRHKGKRK